MSTAAYFNNTNPVWNPYLWNSMRSRLYIFIVMTERKGLGNFPFCIKIDYQKQICLKASVRSALSGTI